jgi:hypothetical protein
MENLICPNCKISLNESQNALTCSKCNLKIRKTYSGYTLKVDDIMTLLKEGKTKEIEFKSRKGNRYTSYLAIINNRVDYGFNIEKENKEYQEYNYIHNHNNVYVRVESPVPGSVNIDIKGLPKYFYQTINFGLASTRECECLGAIVATQYIKWSLDTTENISINFSLNSKEFTRYILKENKPRNHELRSLISYLWEYLLNFKNWTAAYRPKKKQVLEGGNTSNIFPRGIFPWLEVESIEGDSYIGAILPQNPAVIKQFKASFNNAEIKEYPEQESMLIGMLPKKADKALRAWIAIVCNQ